MKLVRFFTSTDWCKLVHKNPQKTLHSLKKSFRTCGIIIYMAIFHSAAVGNDAYKEIWITEWLLYKLTNRLLSRLP